MKNFKVGIIAIIVGIILISGILIFILNQDPDNRNEIIDNLSAEISAITFQIDKTQYNIGEKIFLDMDNMSSSDKGVVLILRPINDTHRTTYLAIPFDGAQKRNNYYLTPQLNELLGICSIDQLTGNWKISFEGTNYSDLKFKVLENILPGAENKYQTIVNKGKC